MIARYFFLGKKYTSILIFKKITRWKSCKINSSFIYSKVKITFRVVKDITNIIKNSIYLLKSMQILNHFLDKCIKFENSELGLLCDFLSNVCMKTQFNFPIFLYEAWYQG